MLGSSNSPLAIDLSLDASLLDPPRQTISLTAGANRQELVFLDATITEAAILTHKFENARVVRLDANVDGITQITNVLKQYQDIASVHIFSHGSESDVQLGNSHLNLANLPTYRENLKQWGNALTNNADLLFYGCNVGAGVDGSTLVQQISQITGADIAASNNFTGNTTLGGDWNLEVQTGKIEAEIVTITGFQGILPIYNGKEYLLTSNAKSWEDAQTEAKNLGGNLVTINDAAEENWLKQNLGTNQPLWIGLTDRTTEGKFEWVNGETATYRNWNPGEPNDYKLSGAYPGEDYAVMNQGTQWNDLPNNYGGIYRGIIERNADFTYDGKKYQLTNSAKSWEDAQAEAKNLGGNLVTINNAAEENWLKQTFGTNQPLWIGLTDRTTEGKFEWVNGETATYRNWNPGEPNDYKLSGAYPGEDYAVMNQGTQWNDLPNNYGGIYRGIIEIGSAPTTKPGTIGLETSTYQIGEAGSTANVAILRKDGSDGTITVDYRTVDASAKAGSDYQAVSGRVTFAPGETRKSIAIPILNDNLAEGNEDFNLTIDNVLGGATLLAPRTATITIQDDEAPTPLVTFNDFTSTSGLTLNGNATQSGNLLRLTTDNPFQTSTAFLNKPLAVDANTSFSTKFQFQLGGSQGTNGGDGFTFMLQNSTTANKALVGGGGNIGYGGISNSIAIEFDTYQNEFDSGNNQISVLRDGVVDKAVIAINAPFDLNSGNRLTAWIDYNGATNNLEVFLSNTTTKPGSATLAYNVDLSTIVGNQAFLGFSAATGGAINTHDIVNWSLTSNSSLLPAPPPPLATTTKPGTIGLETSTYQIGEAGSTANVAILRKDGSDGTITVDYRTVDASAKAGSDYQAVSGRVTFAPGETRKSIAIPILNDNLAEGNEDFNLTIDNVLGGATLLAPRTATITIQDDEAPTPLVTFNDFTSTSGLTLNGNATQSGNLLRLTTDNPFQTSTAFLNKPLAVDANTSFSTKFQFQLGGSQGTNGGDGFTFMLQNSTTANKALVGGGGNIGYGGISNSIAIEFDTYQNEFDSGNNQISVLRDGVVDKAVIAINAPFDLNSGNRLTAWIDYNGATNNLEVFLSNTTTKPGSATLAYNVDLSTIVGNQAFLGFSAATGGAINTHDIVNWSLTSNSSLLPAPPPPLVVQKQTTVTNLSQPISIDWAPDGSKMFIAEKGGVIKVFENGQLKAAPFIDLSKVVNSARDRGLLDIAVHPDFFNGKPYIYAYYTYDPAEVAQNSGLAGADGIGNRANRLTRITADAATNYTTAIAGSEVIILGKNSTWNNFNAFANSTVNFQEKPAGILADGTNLQDFINQDSESHAGGSLQFAPDGSLYVSIGDGTSYNQIDPRTVRVQDIDNLSGKVLRIDPITGAGLANNPFYNGNQDANRSKVYQSGFRNPFRISVDPRNGQLYVGDVGWTQWEEINAGGAGANFGWPYYEGGNGVSFQTGSYQDLPAAKAFYASGKQVTPSILGLNHAADGVNAIMLGDVYTGTKLPAKYQGNLFFNDLGQGIVRNAKLDTAGKITSVETFATGAQYVVQITQGPDGALYYVDLDDGVVGRWQVG